MPNKHFCQGPRCHETVTTDRFLKSRGVIRGRYAYATLDQGPNQWGWQAPDSDKYFCSQSCKFSWLSLNMVDRSSLLDTDEKVVEPLICGMRKELKKHIGVIELQLERLKELILVRGLTIGLN